MLVKRGNREAVELADLFCREARVRIAASFEQFYGPNDDALYKVAMRVLDGRHKWLENGIVTNTHMNHVKPPANGADDDATRTLRHEAAGVG